MLNTNQKRLVRKKLFSALNKSRLFRAVYAICTRHFWLEIDTVLSGVHHYYEEREGQQVTKSSALLRRNTHRLEKGLVMRPRRKTFALDYIEETLEEFERSLEQPDFDKDELKWANDVLSAYFDAIEINTEKLAKLKDRYQNLATEDTTQSNNFAPTAVAPKSHNIPSHSFEELCQKRRSTRHFSNRDVPDEVIIKLVDIASTAPSACNRQPFKFTLIKNATTLSSIANLAMGTQGYRDEIKNLFVVTASTSNYEFERDRHLIYIDSSLATMQMILAMETHGLASCIINWPDIRKKELAIQKLLSLEEHERVIMLITFGYPDPNAMTPYSAKLKHTQQLRVIR